MDAKKVLYIKKAKDKNLNINWFYDNNLTGDQCQQIYYGLEHGLDVSHYAKSNIHPANMSIYRQALLNDIDLSGKSFENVRHELVKFYLDSAIHRSIRSKKEGTHEDYNKAVKAYFDIAVSYLKSGNFKKVDRYIDRGYSLLGLEDFGPVRYNFKTLLDLLKDFIKGNYKGIPITEIAFMLAVVMYVVILSPTIEVPVLGEFDEISVILWALSILENRLREYKEWKTNNEKGDVIHDIK
jgi:uncharacterized membrane protein YkvA (DUF1232 family)